MFAWESYIHFNMSWCPEGSSVFLPATGYLGVGCSEMEAGGGVATLPLRDRHQLTHSFRLYGEHLADLPVHNKMPSLQNDQSGVWAPRTHGIPFCILIPLGWISPNSSLSSGNLKSQRILGCPANGSSDKFRILLRVTPLLNAGVLPTSLILVFMGAGCWHHTG